MYLQKIPEKKSGRTYLTIVRSVWKNGRSHKRTVKSLGYVDELEKVYPDPIAHFTKVVKEMSEKEKTAKTELTMTFAVGETMDFDANNRKNIGYMPFSHLYRELKIDAFFRNRQRSLNVDFKLDHIFRLLIFGRLVFPGSKRKRTSGVRRCLRKAPLVWMTCTAAFLCFTSMRQILKPFFTNVFAIFMGARQILCITMSRITTLRLTNRMT